MPSSVKPSDKLLEMLTMECKARNIGMAVIGSDEMGVCVVLLGDRDLSPDQASVMAADILLQGIITRTFTAANQEENESQEEPTPKDKVN